MTKAEVFKELLKEYEKEATALIWECSFNISQSEKELEKEIAEWAKRYEEAE
jgi:type VI protein secretion system component VasK